MLKELESISSKLNEAHEVLSRTVDLLMPETEQTLVTDQWVAKDVLAHLAGAERGMLRIAQASARGEDPQLPDGYNNDAFNARQVTKRKDQSVAQVLSELRTIHHDLLDFLDGVTAEQLTRIGEHPLYGEIPLKELLVVIYSHKVTHCNEISNALHAAKK